MALALGQRIRDIGRFRDIVAVLAKNGFGQVVDLLELEERRVIRSLVRSQSAPDQALTTPERLAKALEELGPTFIKLGQILATRPDLLPEGWTASLTRLQSQVAPEPVERITAVIEHELGRSVDELFASFDPEPVAAASIAQVHHATLEDGTEVAVKVIRPEIRRTIDSDIDILYMLAALAGRLPEARPFNPRGIVSEMDRAIHRELDLSNELVNVQRFRENFEDLEWVQVPRPYPELSSRSVLTMDFVRGARFTDYEEVGCDRITLAQRGVQTVLKMAFEDGFFHADPHPANVLALPDNRIAFLDMGMTGSLDRPSREKIVTLLEALIRDDPDRIAEATLALGEAEHPVDFSAFRKDVVGVYEDHVRGRSIKDVRIAIVLRDLFKIADSYEVSVPASYTLLIKSLVTMEGVAKEIYPELDIFQEARPYLTRMMLERYRPERITSDLTDVLRATHTLMTGLPRRIDKLLGDLERGRVTVRMEDANPDARLVQQRAASRIALGVMGGGAAVAGSMLLESQPVVGWIALGMAAGCAFLVVLGVLWPRG